MTGDDNKSNALALAGQREEINDGLLRGKLQVDGVWLPWKLFVTGDLAFLNAFYGLNPVASTHGNVWYVWNKADKVLCKCVTVIAFSLVCDLQSDIRKRKILDCYLLSHRPPPGHKWPAAISCRCCGFTACCDEDVRKDADELALMKDQERRGWQAVHEGNVPHQEPVLMIDIENCMPPMYHFAENLIDYWFHHTIWDETEMYEKKRRNEMRHDINVVLKEHIGYCHVPANRGDDCYCMSWIGQDINNLRASLALPLMLHKVWPKEMEWRREAHKAAPPMNENEMMSEEVAALQAAADDSSGSDDDTATEMQAAAAAADMINKLDPSDKISKLTDDVALSNLPRPYLVAMAADLRFELIDKVLASLTDCHTQLD